MRGAFGLLDKVDETLAVKKILDRAVRQNRDLTVYEKEVISRIRLSLNSNGMTSEVATKKVLLH
jgi:hypothetical protein